MSQHTHITLEGVLQAVLDRFMPNNPLAPSNEFIFGFVTPDEPPLALAFSMHGARLETHVKNAEYVLYAPLDVLADLLNTDIENRVALVAQLDMRPPYPFNNYLLSILLNTFDLAIADLDYSPRRFDGPFPFPPRYPVAQNSFRQRTYTRRDLPHYEREKLPALIADQHPTWVAMYDKAWQVAFKNLRQPESQSGFVANFIDPAFNANTFLWDTCFMTMFLSYTRQFVGIDSLNNFYAKQHDDGFICREINTYSGKDLFQSQDPRSTGPNILAWTEWQSYSKSGDNARLHAVFPALVGYHRWWKTWRTHPDGGYWTSGWGSGMDNQTRIPQSEYHHRHYTWVDATLQQLHSYQILLMIGKTIGRDEFNAELQAEADFLQAYVDKHLWDEAKGFYFDRAPDGTRSTTKSIGAFWALLCQGIPQTTIQSLVQHLQDPASFYRPHPVPTQAYDSADYNPYGGYWLGGVWSPTNYMVLRGLTHQNQHDLAHDIALKHVQQVAQVFHETATLWENYAPEHPQHGIPAQGEFVGWTGLSAISIPIEYLLGIRTQVIDGANSLIWDIRLRERHGVLRYPYGQANMLDLICEARAHANDAPTLHITTAQTLTLTVCYAHTRQTLTLGVGQHTLTLMPNATLGKNNHDNRNSRFI
jgi:hypothetical protein